MIISINHTSLSSQRNILHYYVFSIFTEYFYVKKQVIFNELLTSVNGIQNVQR